MINYRDFNYSQLEELPLVKNHRGEEFFNVSTSLDIETTSTEIQGEKIAFIYIWMFTLPCGTTLYGRTWEELKILIANLKEVWGFSPERVLPVYVHNLAYEFQFMRFEFDWLDVFAVGERKPIRASIAAGIEFRCSYILSGYSLAKTAENLTTYNIEKMLGDLDYQLIRTPKTPLTSEELGYCENDAVIVWAYVKEQIEEYGSVAKIPMTNTGRVRQYVRKQCYTRKGGQYRRYKQIMEDLTLDAETYVMLKRAFMGGFTHANAVYSGKVLEGVDSIDLSSSYPTVMISERYPMSRAKPLEVKNYRELKKLARNYCLIFDLKLEGVENVFKHESYISESKCRNVKGAVIDNGRIYSAESLETTITCVDFEIIEAVYSWETISIKNLKGFAKGQLPKPIVSSILNLYRDKTELKDVEGKEVEYMLSKGMLNSVYGMCVTDIVQPEYKYTDDWSKAPIDIKEAIEEYNESRNRFLYYPWGVWVTAYARRNVWMAILSLKEDYVYCDTDSVKMLNYEKNLPFIEYYNDRILNRLRVALKRLKLDSKAIEPENIKGVKKPLGVWEHEGHYARFKTLGAKRYLYEENGKRVLTVAGLSKQNGLKYMESKGGDVFDQFTNSLHIPRSETGKMTHTYIDHELNAVIEDCYGVKCEVFPKSGVHLEPCEFTLSIGAQYLKFIEMLAKGYIFKGVKNL